MSRILIRFSSGSWQVLLQKPGGWMEEVGTLRLPVSATPTALVRAAMQECRSQRLPVPSQPEILIDPMPEPPYDSTDLELRDMRGQEVATWKHKTGEMMLGPPIAPSQERIQGVSRPDAVALFLDAASEFCLDLLVVRAVDLPQQFVAPFPRGAE